MAKSSLQTLETPMKATLGDETLTLAERRLDYRMRQIVASNLAQAAIICSEKPLTPKEIAVLFASIFGELRSQD